MMSSARGGGGDDGSERWSSNSLGASKGRLCSTSEGGGDSGSGGEGEGDW